MIELGFGVMIGEVRRHRPGWTPTEAYLRHGAPSDRRWHRSLLGSNVVHDADRNALLFESALLELPTARGDAGRHAPLAERYTAAVRSAAGMEAIRTEALVRFILPLAPVDIDIVAKRLHRSRRTLQRRLAAEGTTFAMILDRVRAGLAQSYLTESSLTVAQIAEILQFSETSTLSRAVRRWHASSPRNIRARKTQGVW